MMNISCRRHHCHSRTDDIWLDFLQADETLCKLSFLRAQHNFWLIKFSFQQIKNIYDLPYKWENLYTNEPHIRLSWIPWELKLRLVDIIWDGALATFTLLFFFVIIRIWFPKLVSRATVVTVQWS